MRQMVQYSDGGSLVSIPDQYTSDSLHWALLPQHIDYQDTRCDEQHTTLQVHHLSIIRDMSADTIAYPLPSSTSPWLISH